MHLSTCYWLGWCANLQKLCDLWDLITNCMICGPRVHFGEGPRYTLASRVFECNTNKPTEHETHTNCTSDKRRRVCLAFSQTSSLQLLRRVMLSQEDGPKKGCSSKQKTHTAHCTNEESKHIFFFEVDATTVMKENNHLFSNTLYREEETCVCIQHEIGDICGRGSLRKRCLLL